MLAALVLLYPNSWFIKANYKPDIFPLPWCQRWGFMVYQ